MTNFINHSTDWGVSSSSLILPTRFKPKPINVFFWSDFLPIPLLISIILIFFTHIIHHQFYLLLSLVPKISETFLPLLEAILLVNSWKKMLQSCFNHIMRIRSANRFSYNILNTKSFKNSSHRSTSNNTCTWRGGS